eukprot:522303-Amphidinium_carterae.1
MSASKAYRMRRVTALKLSLLDTSCCHQLRSRRLHILAPNLSKYAWNKYVFTNKSNAQQKAD